MGLVEESMAVGKGGRHVSLDVYVMSRCPDAVYAVGFLKSRVLNHFSNAPRDIDGAAGRRGNITTHVHMLLDWLTPETSSSQRVFNGQGVEIEDYQEGRDYECRHGHLECVGNGVALAVEAATEGRSPRGLDFLDAWFRQGDSLDHIGKVPSRELDDALADPAAGPITASEVKRVWEILGETGESKEAMAMVAASGAAARKKGIQYSATVVLNGETVAVRDGGQWKETEASGLGDDAAAWVMYIERLMG
ncbi:hypothetical protein PYCC9005_003143 [Savitreella phatthalungensis]